MRLLILVLLLSFSSCKKSWVCECTGTETTITYRYNPSTEQVEREKVVNPVGSTADMQETEANAELLCAEREVYSYSEQPWREWQTGFEYELETSCELRRKP